MKSAFSCLDAGPCCRPANIQDKQFILTIQTEQDRNTYLDHPAPKAFGQLLGPILDDVLIDVWAGK